MKGPLKKIAKNYPNLSILYVGPMVNGSTTMQRAQALRDLGHELTWVNTESSIHANVRPSFLSRVIRKIAGPRDKVKANETILNSLVEKPYDVLWIDKGLTIHPKTLELAKAMQVECKIIGFSPDDMINPANQSRHFLQGLPLYDFYITTKSYNVSEIQELGCSKVFFMENAFDPHTHRPLPVDGTDRERLGGPVGFIGQWELERAESLRKLALAGIPVRVWGYTWERMKNVPAGLILENRPLWGDEYARALSSFDINLCFLRKCNRDLQTTRTIEIPACGAFMLAERTEEHLRMFAEGQEAEFFTDEEEFIRKVRYYLSDPDKRMSIANRGLKRCLRDGYSYGERINQILERIYN